MNKTFNPFNTDGVNQNRRSFWRKLVPEITAVYNEMKGIQQQSLAELASLSDSTLAEMIPVWREESNLEVCEEGLYIKKTRSPAREPVYKLSHNEWLIVRQFNCGRNIRAIANGMAKQAKMDYVAAFKTTRDLFIRLSQKGLCHLAACHRNE